MESNRYVYDDKPGPRNPRQPRHMPDPGFRSHTPHRASAGYVGLNDAPATPRHSSNRITLGELLDRAKKSLDEREQAPRPKPAPLPYVDVDSEPALTTTR
jgi:hypothetical protein